MTTHQIEARMTRRLQMTQTHWGRARLSAYVRVKRIAWLMVYNGAYIAKRTIDIVISGVALLMASPVLLVVAILIKLDGGPIFFGQTRVGLHGQEFKMLKFRSMCVDAEKKLSALLASNEKGQGVTFKIKNDPRITRIGRFLRKTSMDEVPQFINVIKGEMSLVGPRPALPREVAMYSEQHRCRLLVVPGLTCFWQVGEREGRLFEIGDRNSIDFDEQVSLDVRYIESQSVLRDIWLLIKTIPAVLLGRGM